MVALRGLRQESCCLYPVTGYPTGHQDGGATRDASRWLLFVSCNRLSYGPPGWWRYEGCFTMAFVCIL